MHDIISIFKYILESNIINFILMLIILEWIIRKINMGKSLDSSVSAVEAYIKKSVDEHRISEEKLIEAKALIEGLPDEVETLKQAVADKGEIFKKEIASNADKSIQRFEKNIASILEVEGKKISNVLTDKTTVASVELAKLQIIKMLESEPELHHKFIDNSLEELGKVKL